MISKKYKLSTKDFLKLIKAKKTVLFQRSDFFIIKINPNGLNYNRFGLVINKKTAAKATQRNKIKRIIYNFIKKENFFSGQADISITVLNKTAGLSEKEIENNLRKDLRKVFFKI
ncbi:MAG: ribonuclease P protein component [Patescibacteria group bacterium]|nr:ribonuclease P protein component [Patescibacteria group bacterium]